MERPIIIENINISRSIGEWRFLVLHNPLNSRGGGLSIDSKLEGEILKGGMDRRG